MAPGASICLLRVTNRFMRFAMCCLHPYKKNLMKCCTVYSQIFPSALFVYLNPRLLQHQIHLQGQPFPAGLIKLEPATLLGSAPSITMLWHWFHNYWDVSLGPFSQKAFQLWPGNRVQLSAVYLAILSPSVARLWYGLWISSVASDWFKTGSAAWRANFWQPGKSDDKGCVMCFQTGCSSLKVCWLMEAFAISLVEKWWQHNDSNQWFKILEVTPPAKTYCKVTVGGCRVLQIDQPPLTFESIKFRSELIECP